ncbi:MAG: TlyA family RNA methyltransferase [Opitutales bacterium]|jgi:23S rRNA (cytidine1920-2'-O)/16S rRNA (cytidine1409-2'-O)-methyltransferase
MKSDKPQRAHKLRLDEILARRGLAESRTQARLLILAGKVRSGTNVLDKPGHCFPEDIALDLLQPPRFVSRGGEKLQGFLEAFPIPLDGALVLDVGASTGGFTDCALQHGAAHVTCVDVGKAQLHDKMRRDPRVTNIEGLNARFLNPAALPHSLYDALVMDLSFISLTSVLPAVWPALKPGGSLVCLIKPQFEVGKKDADRFQGVIRDEALRTEVVEKIRAFAHDNLPGSSEIGLITSPIQGAEGNVEFLLGLRKSA